MNFNDFYIHAIREKAHWDRDWVIRVFTITQEAPDAYKNDLRAYRPVATPVGHYFVDPNTQQLVSIEDRLPGKPLAVSTTPITVPANFFEHWPEGGQTTAGNLFFNATCIWPSVGKKIPYINQAFSQGKIEDVYFSKMQDDPEEGNPKDPDVIYVSEWLTYGKCIRYLTEFTQIFVWSLTEDSIIVQPAVVKRKKELLEQYKDQLDDPIVQTKIIKELETLDAEIQKSQPDHVFMGGKKAKQARRKLTGLFGAERGLDNVSTPRLITSSLSEGFKPEDLVEVMNVSRAGSFDRGSETMLGGVEYKWAERVMAGSKVQEQDCQTTLGYTYTVQDKDIKNTVGRYRMLSGGKIELIANEEQAKALVGQTITVRAPNRCKAGPSTTWCKYCLGDKLSSNPTAIGLAVGAYSGGFLQIFLDSMHSKAPVMVKMDLRALMH